MEVELETSETIVMLRPWGGGGGEGGELKYIFKSE